MIVNNIKISQKMKNEEIVEYRKRYYEMQKNKNLL